MLRLGPFRLTYWGLYLSRLCSFDIHLVDLWSKFTLLLGLFPFNFLCSSVLDLLLFLCLVVKVLPLVGALLFLLLIWTGPSLVLLAGGNENLWGECALRILELLGLLFSETLHAFLFVFLAFLDEIFSVAQALASLLELCVRHLKGLLVGLRFVRFRWIGSFAASFELFLPSLPHLMVHSVLGKELVSLVYLLYLSRTELVLARSLVKSTYQVRVWIACFSMSTNMVAYHCC